MPESKVLFRGLDLMMLNASSVAVPEGFQIIANGFIPDMGPNTGYHNPTLLLSVLLLVLLVVLELRKRTEQRKHQMDVTPLPVSVLKLALIGAAVLAFGLLLASYKGVPVVGLILGVLVAIYTSSPERPSSAVTSSGSRGVAWVTGCRGREGFSGAVRRGGR